MIDISFKMACLLYLSITLGALFAVGFYFHIKKKDREGLELSKLYICEYCQHVYLDDIDLKITPCPQCHLLNRKNNYSKNNFT
jgi:hypothetical protein